MIYPGTVLIYNTTKQIWEESTKDEAEAFFFAMLNIPPNGFSMYNQIYRFYTTPNNKYSICYGGYDRWYIQGANSTKLRQIMRIQEGASKNNLLHLEREIFTLF